MTETNDETTCVRPPKSSLAQNVLARLYVVRLSFAEVSQEVANRSRCRNIYLSNSQSVEARVKNHIGGK